MKYLNIILYVYNNKIIKYCFCVIYCHRSQLIILKGTYCKHSQCDFFVQHNYNG